MIAKIMMLYTLYDVFWSHTDSIDNIWYDALYTKLVQLLNIKQREFYFICKHQIIILYKVLKIDLEWVIEVSFN